jgi:hypothetical protein
VAGLTLAGPHWVNDDGSLKRFDFAVANPPFSYKAWSNGLDPAHDDFGRFAYGIPPARNGDYAFLLHALTSLKSRGKAVVVMPYGVLFRGNVEADIRRIITDERQVNPKYFDEMSELLGALIRERRQEALEYAAYLEKVKALATMVVQPCGDGIVRYPESMNTRAKRALYDNLDRNEELATRIDTAVRYTKKDGWVGKKFKEREVANAIREELGEYNVRLDEVIELVKKQDEYR